jgi:lipopolysaccharide/colanic/teichoic acid biosynthesis glycosyltransferase
MYSNIKLPDDTGAYLKQYKRYFIRKRALDILFSIIALIILSPLFLAVAVAIKINSKGKIIYSQPRTGKNGIPFVMFKFRSMYENAEAKRNELLDRNEMDGPVFKISNDPRVTTVGRFIRRYSIDELPQLVNILRGEMSIVGPRPLVVYEAAELNDNQKLRHLIKPGLTCYWQVSGRNNLSFQDWMNLDLKYLTEMSMKTDLIIILRTFKVVFLKEGAY